MILNIQVLIAQLADWKAFRAGTKFPANLVGQINGMTRIPQLKFHPTDTNKYYAITSQGGLFLSNDQGNTWNVAPGTENMTTNSSSICIDYSNTQTLLLGTGDPNYYSNGLGVFKSTDNGVTFNATGLTNCLVIEILQNPLLATEFVAATNKGIYKSIDGGQVWNAVTSTAIQFCHLISNANVNSQTLYAASLNNSALFYRSIDFGSTWTNITSGITTATKYITAGARIGVTPADTNVVYFEAIGGGGIVHKSNDGGLNFTVKKIQGLPCITFYTETDTNSSSQGNYNNTICVDAKNPAKIWLQAHNTMYSSDSGATWTRLTHWASKVHTDMHHLQQAPFNSNKLYSCNDGGIWLSVDGGNTWVPKCDGIYGFEIGNNTGVSSLTRKDFVSIGTQDNARLYGDATGWYTISGGDDYAKRQFDYNGNIYIDGTNRQINHTGSSVSYNLPTLNWTSFAFNRLNKNLAFMSNNDSIFRTTNLTSNTPTWTLIKALGSGIRALHSCIGDTNRLYVLLNNGDVYSSFDALTVTPNFIFSNLPGSASSTGSIVAMANNASIVYVAENNTVYRSADSGVTWTNVKYNLPNVNHRRILAEDFGGNSELVLLATNNAVYYKKAGQITWTNYSSNLPSRKSPTEFSMYDDETNESRIRYATYGRGVWESGFDNLRDLKAKIIVLNDTTITCTSPSIQFADGSIGTVNTPISYNWSFPNGTPSASIASNVNVTYSTTGTYTAYLTITDGLGTISKTSVTRFIQIIPCNTDTIPGNVLNVRGSSNYAKTNVLPLGNTNTVTMSAWIKIETNQVSYAGILFSPNAGATGLNFRNGNQIGYHWNDLSSSYNYSGGGTVPLGVWTHVALVVSATDAKLYLNGVAAINNIAHAAINFTNGFNLGNDRNNNSRTMDGMMDEICFYNRALSQNEIRELMHLTKNYSSVDTNLKAYYQCNEIGNTLYNRVGNVNATIQGTADHGVSTAPVGSGASERQTIITAGIYNFGNEGMNITFASGTNPNGEIAVTRINLQPDSVPPGKNFVKLAAKYWIVNNYGTNANFTALSNISLSGYGNILNSDSALPKVFKLYKRGSGEHKSSSWGLFDSASSATTGINGKLSFDNAAITSFSQFTIFNTSKNALLPIQLSLFTVKCVNRNSTIDWKTSSELNSDYFAIEFSSDSNNWTEAAKVNAAGTSNTTLSYQYLHKNIGMDKIYYRLKQVDLNGDYAYSNIIYIECPNDPNNSIIYPIPFTNTLNINLGKNESYKIFDIIGKLIYTGNETVLNTEEWAKGMYVFQFKTDKFKFLKE